MSDGATSWERWRPYRVSKAEWFWSCVVCVILTVIVGFTWGGWMTRGTATKMATTADEQARADLAATACVERFLGASDASKQLASLKETKFWQTSDFIEKGGWATMPGMKEPVTGSADACAQRLANMELPPKKQTADIGKTSVTTR